MASKGTLRVGDRVAFSEAWLRTAGHMDALTKRRGAVTTIVLDEPGYRLLEVRWDSGWFGRVLESNLVLEGRRALET